MGALSSAINTVPPGLPLPLTTLSRSVADAISVTAHVEKAMSLASHVSASEPGGEEGALVASCVARIVVTVDRVVVTMKRLQALIGSRLTTRLEVVKRLLARLVHALSPIPGKGSPSGHKWQHSHTETQSTISLRAAHHALHIN